MFGNTQNGWFNPLNGISNHSNDFNTISFHIPFVIRVPMHIPRINLDTFAFLQNRCNTN